MGDRANVVIPQQYPIGASLYLYTHWGGAELPWAVQRALSRRVRWDDAPYLARIIFDAMTEGRHGSETGHGISTFICDNQYPILIVDVVRQQVRFEEYVKNPEISGRHMGRTIAIYTFKEYVKLDEAKWPEDLSSEE